MRAWLVIALLLSAAWILASGLLLPRWLPRWEEASVIIGILFFAVPCYRARSFKCPRCGKDYYGWETSMHFFFVKRCRNCGLGQGEGE